MKIIEKVTMLLLASFLLAGTAWAGHKDRINGPINEPQDITRQCLRCHEEAGKDFMKTSHWQWSLEQVVDGKKVARGKKNAINNYCTAVSGNEKFCGKCHAGYGMEDSNTFDFGNPENIDCLVCHDTTGNYSKGTGTAGYPAENVDLLFIARNVGAPNRDNCGQCHFFGGGGDAVKHGDLDSSMAYPEKSIDVHMNVDGEDLACIACHVTRNHVITGNSLGVSPGGKTPVDCATCHAGAVHAQSRLNAHLDTVACQTCHIPEFAREKPTKVWWDWSKAGEDREYDEKDDFGHHTYVKKKGEMQYATNISPEYRWYNGSASAYNRGDKFNPQEILRLTYPLGSRDDRKSKIFPFKVMRGKQIYDAKNLTLVTAKLVGKGGYWTEFDWKKSATLGSQASGMPFSGEYAFAETEMWWRINHMVSPKEKALGCLDCHGDNGRLDWQAFGYKGDPMTNAKWSRSQ